MASHTQRRMFTPAQLRAARALLDWTRDDLAEKSGVAAVTAIGFEHGKTDPKVSTLYKWKRALEAAGVTFIEETETDGPGVRLKKQAGKRR
jgi:transcriptional regulator with XRE-family HTH domain